MEEFLLIIAASFLLFCCRSVYGLDKVGKKEVTLEYLTTDWAEKSKESKSIVHREYLNDSVFVDRRITYLLDNTGEIFTTTDTVVDTFMVVGSVWKHLYRWKPMLMFSTGFFNNKQHTTFHCVYMDRPKYVTYTRLIPDKEDTLNNAEVYVFHETMFENNMSTEDNQMVIYFQPELGIVKEVTPYTITKLISVLNK